MLARSLAIWLLALTREMPDKVSSVNWLVTRALPVCTTGRALASDWIETVPTSGSSNTVPAPAGITTAATLARSGIAPPAQLFALDHRPSPALPVQLTLANWLMVLLVLLTRLTL